MAFDFGFSGRVIVGLTTLVTGILTFILLENSEGALLIVSRITILLGQNVEATVLYLALVFGTGVALQLLAFLMERNVLFL